jgi:hypothetical protein
MFANILASAPAGVELAVASTTLLGLAGLGYRYLRLRSNERIVMKMVDTGESMHARETVKEMHRNELAANYGMHANQLGAELKAAQLQARMEQYWAGAMRGLNPSFTILPPERSTSLELSGRMGRQVWDDREITDLPDLLRVIENSKLRRI